MPITTKPFESLNETVETFDNSELLIVNEGNNPQRLPLGSILNSELIRNELKYLEEMTQEEIDELYPLLVHIAQVKETYPKNEEE